ncbi:hypothetical protein PG990_011495 [Apiospora arundinis]
MTGLAEFAWRPGEYLDAVVKYVEEYGLEETKQHRPLELRFQSNWRYYSTRKCLTVLVSYRAGTRISTSAASASSSPGPGSSKK